MIVSFVAYDTPLYMFLLYVFVLSITVSSTPLEINY